MGFLDPIERTTKPYPAVISIGLREDLTTTMTVKIYGTSKSGIILHDVS
jgi:hypothetical protein